MSAKSTPPVNAKVSATTIGELRALALSQAAAWNTNEAGLRDNGNLMSWRDNCRDDVRDNMGVDGKTLDGELLRAWVSAFDGAVYDASDLADDIQCKIEVVNDLLRLALDQLVSLPDCRADAAIRGARRFIDDIKAIAERLHQVGETGGAS